MPPPIENKERNGKKDVVGMEKPLLALLCDLIRMEATSATAINQSATFCAEWLNRHGLKTEVLMNQGLKSVVASKGAHKPGKPTVVLNGHLDVVPGEPHLFEPKIVEDRLYARGSYDMLGAVAAMMMAMVELREEELDCNVLLQLVPDEETGGMKGTGFLAQNGFLGDFVICGEPTNLHIAVQAKGVLQLKVEVTGVAAHGSRPWLGKNAILCAMDVYRKIEGLDFLKQSSAFYDRPSFNIARIEAGGALNQVPDACSFCLDIRYLPGQDRDEILSDIRRAVPEADVSVLQEGAPVLTSADDPYVQLLRHSTSTVAAMPVRMFGQDGSADTRFFAAHGIPAVEFGPIGANHHGPDEYVEIPSLFTYQKIIEKFVQSIQGREDVK